MDLTASASSDYLDELNLVQKVGHLDAAASGADSESIFVDLTASASSDAYYLYELNQVLQISNQEGYEGSAGSEVSASSGYYLYELNHRN